MTHFEIAHPWVFLLIPLPLLVYWAWPALRKRRTGLIVPFFQRAVKLSGQKPRRGSWVASQHVITWSVLIFCWISLLAAAASPQLTGVPAKRSKTVRSFLIATDISFSMAERDWIVKGQHLSRWDAVRSILKEFIKKRKSDQIGLVMFGTHAYLQAPLTTDLDAINWLLDQTEVGMAGQMTSMGEAITYGIKIFAEDTIRQKVMLLLTDGIDSGSDILPLDAANQARKDSIVIYTLGIGKTQGQGGYNLDEKTLQEIANSTGGRYFNASNEKEMEEVYNLLNHLQPVVYEEESYRPVTLLYYYPLALVALLGLLLLFLKGSFRLLFRKN